MGSFSLIATFLTKSKAIQTAFNRVIINMRSLQSIHYLEVFIDMYFLSLNKKFKLNNIHKFMFMISTWKSEFSLHKKFKLKNRVTDWHLEK